MRSRAQLTNLYNEKYTLEDLVLSFPIPAEATELLDFAGNHNYERIPQRGTLRTGTHLRENRKGRTGADSAYILHAGAPGFGFGHGDVWAVHAAWSGNHQHYAERVYSGEQLLGGGELLLPGEIRLGRGDSYTSPWIYASYGTGLDEVAHRFHAHVRSRTAPVFGRAAGDAQRVGGRLLRPRRGQTHRPGRARRRHRRRTLRAR
nr:glycoside hydrolase family 36 N-terminal domain-containing protein [Arthrobacter sp. ok909]